jgi:Ti type entry exclusion protein TrbK
VNRLLLIILVTSVTSGAAAASYFLIINPATVSSAEYHPSRDQRNRDFFRPAPKRDLHSGQEMRPRW